MGELAVREVVPKSSLNSITNDMRGYLLQKAQYDELNLPYDESIELESVYIMASKKGMTFEDYVLKYSAEAVILSQRYLGYWEQFLANAATGQTFVNRNQVPLIERAVTQAQDAFDKVQWILACGAGDDLRKERLIKAMYNKALRKGDLKAMQYLIDRVDGKIGEEQNAQKLDDSYKGAVYRIVHTLFDKQLDVLNAGAGSSIICCSRKAGKTHLLAGVALIEALMHTNTTVIIVGRTMQVQEDLIRIEMNKIIEACDLTDQKGNKLRWQHLDNGSKIVVRGLSNTEDPDVIRGYNAAVIIMDEFFHMKSDLLEYMQSEVLKPMQLTYARSYKLIMVGTPPRIKNTYGEKLWNSGTIRKFYWTAKENPYIEGFDEFVAKECEEKGITINDPYIRREYFGEWAYDTDALLYPEYHTYDPEEVMPKFNIDRVLIGVDYGTSDNDAIIATAWDSELRRGFVFYESKFNRLTCPVGVTQFEQLKKELKLLWEFALDFWPSISKEEANKRIICCADSSNNHLTDEFAYNLKCKYPDLMFNIEEAHKHDTILMQDKIKAMFKTAALLLPANGRTAQECDMTVLKRDPMGHIFPDIDHKAYHPDLLPALRYSLWPAIGEEVLKERGV